MEELPEYIKINKNVYWLNITKENGKWYIAYHEIEVGEDDIKLAIPPILLAAGELNKCVADVMKKIKALTNNQPKSTN